MAFVNHLLKDRGGIFLLRCNYDLNEFNINSIFYKERLQWWADFRVEFSKSLQSLNVLYGIIRTLR